jgi:hypothetical protein
MREVRRLGGREANALRTAVRFAGASPSTIFTARLVDTGRRVAGLLRFGLLRFGLLRFGLGIYIKI